MKNIGISLLIQIFDLYSFSNLTVQAACDTLLWVIIVSKEAFMWKGRENWCLQ